MGQLRTRKRGSVWQYSFEAAPIDGKRKSISKSGFRTKADAIAAGTQAMNDYNNAGATFVPSEISISDYLDYWFDSYCKMNLKYNTQLGYLNIIENHLKPRFGNYRLRSLTTAAVQEYANHLKMNGMSKASAKGVISVLSASYEYAIEPLQYVKENPCARIKFPKFERRQQKRQVINPEYFKRILDRFPEGNIFHIPLLIGYYTGLRISETFALTWDDIDFKNKTLSVDKTVLKRNYGVDVRNVLKLAQIAGAVNSKSVAQPFHNRLAVFLRQFPQPGIFTAPHRMGVSHIMHIVQIRLAAVSFADQRDSRAACIDPPAHFIVPGRHIRAGRRVRLLCVN